MMFPLVHEIPYADPMHVVLHLDRQYASVVFLDSALHHPHLGRYSFIAIDPFETLVDWPEQRCFFKEGSRVEDSYRPFAQLDHLLMRYALPTVPDLPPFQGGACGFFSYDLCRDFEPIPTLAQADIAYPRLALGLHDLVVSFDHWKKRSWVFSSGFPDMDPGARERRARRRLDGLVRQLEPLCQKPSLSLQDVGDIALVPGSLRSNFTPSGYIQAVQRVIDAIAAGDLFEANLAQRFQCLLSSTQDPIRLYQKLRQLNPAPFAAYVKLAGSRTMLLSASPERFLAVRSGAVEARPIKGTRPRSRLPDEDRRLAAALVQSVKDRAENTMIVDLMRNDLSRVCLPHSVQVPQYCQLESYATVHHLVSTVCGQLDPQRRLADVLRATFPGGSITGAPKVRAMQLIEALEPHRRGPYCGSVGYLGFNSDMDISIVIRSYVLQQQRLTWHAGGAVVLDSDPEQEYQETLTKARVLHRVLGYSL